jgi:hypothetical protein
MANTKISALTSSTTPLAGTEVLPIVQSGATVKVAVSDLTAGRAVSVASIAITGGSSAAGVISKDATTGLQIRGIAGSGYDLEITNSGGATAQTIATGTYKTKFWDDVSTLGNVVISTSGKGIDFSATSGTGTSELLADYEEGTWTPNQGAGLNVVGTFSSQGTYTKIGRMVYITGRVTGSTSIAIPAIDFICTNLPFTIGAASVGNANTGTLSQSTQVIAFSGTSLYGQTTAAASFIYFSVSYPV